MARFGHTTSQGRLRWRAGSLSSAVSIVLLAGLTMVPARASERLSAAEPDRPIPVLTYHVIEPAPAGAPDSGLYVSAELFAAQMEDLAAHGYQAVTLQQVYDDWRHGGTNLPPRPLVVSFDDGYASIHRSAAPVLRSLGWPAVLFLTTSYMDRAQPPFGLRPEMVNDLLEAGWEIDAHTLTHPDLTALDQDQLPQEVAGSRRAIQEQFGLPANFFAYPMGFYDAAAVDAVKASGFLGAVSTRGGLAAPADLFALRRVWARSVDGVDGIAQRLKVLERSWERRVAASNRSRVRSRRHMRRRGHNSPSRAN